jgi:hypothetical protein
MTFCEAMELPSFTKTPPPALQKAFQKKTLHQQMFESFYLPCFYAKLFKKIDPSDLVNKEKVFPENYALSYLIPLLEMTENHFQYIQETLYLTTHSIRLSPSKFEDFAPWKEPYPSLICLFEKE